MSYDEPLKVLDKDGLRIEVDYESHVVMSPREWDNITTMYCMHGQYNIGDDHNYKESDFNGWGEFREEIEDRFNVLAIEPLYMYDHSGITISTSPFRSSWDSGKIGYVFITEETVERLGNEKCKKRDDDYLHGIIQGDVDVYDKYIRGEVYKFKITDKNTGEVLDSCGGFYDKEHVIDRAKSMADHILQKRREKRQEKVKAMIENDVPMHKREAELAKLES